MRRRWGLVFVLLFCGALSVFAQNSVNMPGFSIQLGGAGVNEPEGLGTSIRIVMLLTVLSLAPSIVIMMTSFTRILVVFGFMRKALGTQSSPPNQVLAGMALILTTFIMMPVWKEMDANAIKPYQAKELNAEQAWVEGLLPLRRFMASQTGESEYALFVELSGKDMAELEQAELSILVPSFILSEMKTAFKLGFLVYLPFLLIDLVTASTLMSLGMMMLPPMTVSLPIKILFFVLADGWTILIRGILSSFVG
jgi:flagellar biosynthesis protein FliP